MKSKKYIAWVKYGVYVIIIILLCVLQTTPRLFSISGVKPNLLAACAVCIAMHEGELAGGILGAVAGLLCDFGSFTIFGFNGILLLAGCVAVGLLTIYFTQLKLTNALLLGGGVLFLRALVEYFFYFYMWGYEGSYRIFFFSSLPGVLYSVAAIVPLYHLIRRIKAYFAAKMKV